MSELNQSPEAQFHRKIKMLAPMTKRLQGQVMGMFREVMPKDLDAAVKAMWEANQNTADALEALIKAKDELRDAKLQNSVLLGRLNNRCEKVTALEAELVLARQATQQSRKASLAETLTSTSLGFLGSLGITWATLAAITTVGTASLVATVGCTAWSLVRGYTVRRYFNSRG